ncbi:MAG: hypothetical protein DRP46_11950 [Candidatus Zixiibacteriota bacterium]|nr:MAG: hypothetical protein DRP46_11950 [candidate division Zixibacteria bacterium]HDL03176.1 hypothetical protein [candidate division Zixibacteria bacterium]
MGDLICWNCGRATGIEGKVTRNDACPHCRVDLRCCRGCRHFDPASHFQCRETIDAPIPIKDKSNFCDWFQTRLAVHTPGGKSVPVDKKENLKKRFDDLFED